MAVKKQTGDVALDIGQATHGVMTVRIVGESPLYGLARQAWS